MNVNYEIMEWSRNLINRLMTKDNDLNILYKLQFDVKPNPLDYDGIDEISLKILRVNQHNKEVSTLWSCSQITPEILIIKTDEFADEYTK